MVGKACVCVWYYVHIYIDSTIKVRTFLHTGVILGGRQNIKGLFKGEDTVLR